MDRMNHTYECLKGHLYEVITQIIGYGSQEQQP